MSNESPPLRIYEDTYNQFVGFLQRNYKDKLNGMEITKIADAAATITRNRVAEVTNTIRK